MTGFYWQAAIDGRFKKDDVSPTDVFILVDKKLKTGLLDWFTCRLLLIAVLRLLKKACPIMHT